MEINKALNLVEESIQDQEEYSYFLTHSSRYKKILKKIQSISQGGKIKILDIGCYPYHMGKALELLGHEVYGICSKHESIRNKNISIVDIETEKFPYTSNFFDIVLMSEVIEHLPQSPVLCIKESQRVLRKNGSFIITTPNITRSINKVKIIFGKSIMFPIDVYFENNGNGNILYHRHNREYTLEELKEVTIKAAKWNTVEGEFFISYSPWRKRLIPDSLGMKSIKVINFIFMNFFPGFQDTLLLLAIK